MPYTIDITNMSPSEVAEVINEMFMKDLLECFKEIFIDLAKESMRLSIVHNVYAKYRPSSYKRRREDGGLIADKNMNVEVYRDKTTGNIIGYVKNLATGVNRAYELDGVIESGIGYDWDESRIFKMMPYPRPFYQGTIDRIEASNWVYHVRRKMNMRGWHTVGK